MVSRAAERQQVWVPEPCLRQLEQLAHQAFPAEACALLGGAEAKGGILVLAVCPCRNEVSEPGRFLIGPRQVLAAWRRFHRQHQSLVGVFHSHPGGPAVPSPDDRAEAWGDLVLLITACDQARPVQTRCWSVVDGQARELDLRLLSGQAQPACTTDERDLPPGREGAA